MATAQKMLDLHRPIHDKNRLFDRFKDPKTDNHEKKIKEHQ